jgi:hypothetical protein
MIHIKLKHLIHFRHFLKQKTEEREMTTTTENGHTVETLIAGHKTLYKKYKRLADRLSTLACIMEEEMYANEIDENSDLIADCSKENYREGCEYGEYEYTEEEAEESVQEGIRIHTKELEKAERRYQRLVAKVKAVLKEVE